MTTRKPRAIARELRALRERIINHARGVDDWSVGYQRGEKLNELGYLVHRLRILEDEYHGAAGKAYKP